MKGERRRRWWWRQGHLEERMADYEMVLGAVFTGRLRTGRQQQRHDEEEEEANEEGGLCSCLSSVTNILLFKSTATTSSLVRPRRFQLISRQKGFNLLMTNEGNADDESYFHHHADNRECYRDCLGCEPYFYFFLLGIKMALAFDPWIIEVKNV